mgnify:CR=1 FL=1
MEYTLNDDGQLVDQDGKAVLIGEEPVTLKGVRTQAQVDQVIKERLSRQTERIKTLEAQANRTPELETLLESLKAEKTDLESQMAEVRETAKAEAQAQLAKLQKETQSWRERFEAEAKARVRDQVSTQILAAAADRFNDPGTDVVPHLLGVHKREAKKDDSGKPTDEFLDFFKLRYKTEKGEEVEEFMSLDKALDVWAAAHPHHVRSSDRGGAGGGNYTGHGNLKRSEMSVADKVAFIGKYGDEAYRSLPA